MKNVRIYDNGGETLDRFTAVYMSEPEAHPGTFAARGMSERPRSPQGFGQFCIAAPGQHLGRRIRFEDLPAECQSVIRSDLGA